MDNNDTPKKPSKPGLAAYLPLLIVTGLGLLFASMLLSDRNPREVKSVLIGERAPKLTTAYLAGYPQKPIEADKPTVVNFFASWCAPCIAEHASLVELQKKGVVNLIGIAYKDEPQNTARFIERYGNPYDLIIKDESTLLGIEFGVSGVPETYVINKDGIITYRFWSAIVGDALENTLMPEITKAALGVVPDNLRRDSLNREAIDDSEGR